MNIPVINVEGNHVKDLPLNENIWAITPHKQAMFDVILSYRASLRYGNHKTKTRGEVSGGGRKPWKQKGTGRARQGSIRSPQWKGGGVVFGPTPEKNYQLQVNRKVYRLAFRSALSLKLQANDFILVDQLKIEKPSTKAMLAILKKLNLNEQKTLIITGEHDQLVAKSVSNLEQINIAHAKSVNVYELLNNQKILMTEAAVSVIEKGLG